MSISLCHEANEGCLTRVCWLFEGHLSATQMPSSYLLPSLNSCNNFAKEGY